MPKLVNSFDDTIIDRLLPQQCILCGLPSHRNQPLCGGCEGDLQANRHACHRCALPLKGSATRDGQDVCGRCLLYPPPFDRVIAPWLYDEIMAYIIRRWKFHREQRLSGLLAYLWLHGASPFSAEIDLVLPIPLHWRRRWRRGFNQSGLLCRELARQDSLVARAPLKEDLLVRNRATEAQSGMNAQQRGVNLQRAFTVRRPCDNLRLAVVDDVLTTGATATAVAAALRSAGASHIEVWCLARTPAPAN